MKSQAFDSKRRLTNICCLIVALGLVKLVFGAYIMAGGSLFSFDREEKSLDPKTQALAKVREQQLLALKKANSDYAVFSETAEKSQKADTAAACTETAGTKTASAPIQQAQKQQSPAPHIKNQQNDLHVQADLLAQASAATVGTMQAKTRRALLDNAFQNADNDAKEELAQSLDSITPQYQKEKSGFSFSLVGTAHAAEKNSQSSMAVNQNIDAQGVDASEYRRPDQSLTSTNIPVPTIDKPYDSPNVLSYKEAELNQKEEELLSLQEQMNSRMQELNKLEDRLGDMVQQANSVEDEKYSHLIATYAAMKPRKAAEALSTLDEKIAVRILTGMKSKQSGEIFSYMDPVQAARLSKAMTKISAF